MSAKIKVLGVCLGLVANALHLHSMYIIKVSPIQAGDTLILRSLVQTCVFGLWSLAAFFQRKHHQRNEQYRSLVESAAQPGYSTDWKIWAVAVVCSFMMATVVLMTFMAIDMMPLCDFIVFSFTAPIFTLITSYFVLHKRLTALSFIFAFAIVVGAGMVAQPTFIFGAVNPVMEETYAAGVALALACAVLSGASRTLVAKCSRVMSSSDFMLLGGLAALVLGLATPAFRIPNSVLTPAAFVNDENMKFGLASGVESCGSALLLLIGTRVTDDPVLISVVRSTEIVMGLMLDTMVPSTAALIDFSSIFFWYKVIGAVLVTLSVMGITVSDKLYDAILECMGKPSRCLYEEIDCDSQELEDQNSNQPAFNKSLRRRLESQCIHNSK